MRGVFTNSQNLIVRPVSQSEERRWTELMSAHHYLGFNSLLGEQMKYVGILNEQWVALIGWGAAALACDARDRFLEWNTYNCRWRLKHMANNSRFLIMPEVQINNLASRILALNLRRLSSDWQTKYRHPILVVETFVNASLYRGTCYKADNWIQVGKTKGFRKDHNNYYHHGEEKLIFVKPLSKSAFHQLKGIRGEPPMTDIDKLPILGRSGLFELAKTIPDPRSKSGMRHRAPGILVLSILAILSGAKGYKDIAIWSRTVSKNMLINLWLKRTPSESTIRRYLMRLDAAVVDQIISNWLLDHIDLCGQQLALDGKTLRGSHDGDKTPIKLVASVIAQSGIVISQKAIPATTNEIPVVQNMIRDLPIENMNVTVTGDALHSQDKTSKTVFDKKSDSVFILKDNQKIYRHEVAEALSDSAFSPSPSIL